VSDPDPNLIIPDPDPALTKIWIRIHKTKPNSLLLLPNLPYNLIKIEYFKLTGTGTCSNCSRNQLVCRWIELPASWKSVRKVG